MLCLQKEASYAQEQSLIFLLRTFLSQMTFSERLPWPDPIIVSAGAVSG